VTRRAGTLAGPRSSHLVATSASTGVAYFLAVQRGRAPFVPSTLRALGGKWCQSSWHRVAAAAATALVHRGRRHDIIAAVLGMHLGCTVKTS